MKAITLSIFLVGLCFGFAVTANAQAADQQDWQTVMQLPAAANVRIETKDKHKKTAWLVAVTDTEVKLEDDGEIFTYRRDEIKKLWQLREPNRTKQRIFSGIGLTAGTFAGIVIGMGLGLRQCGRSCNEEKVGGMAAIIGLPVAGGVIGYKLAGNGKPVLVYATP
ncbi:MAG: hypothetical protein HOP19_21435 [Acidobacteria bacterium]|nr:hypothetical protein [Acidobacteriota bacterium]